jgi:hypothetical protein
MVIVFINLVDFNKVGRLLCDWCTLAKLWDSYKMVKILIKEYTLRVGRLI